MNSVFLLKKNQKGFNLLEIMVATAMLTIAGLAVMALSQLSNQDSLQLKALRVALTGRTSIEAALKNPAAWRQTVAQNASFTCVSSPSGCDRTLANNGYYDFVLYGVGVGEKVTYEIGDGTTRYAIRGGNCPAGTADPDPQCPLKFMARWKPLCQAYPCRNPTLDIKVSLVSEFGTSSPPFNPQKYELATVRGIDDGSIQSACQILNGTYNTLTGTCYPKNAGKSCAALGKSAEIVSSVADDGSITCAPLYSGQCNPNTEVMKGISSSGVAQCAARVQPANCTVDCVGGFGACSAPCGPTGTQIFTVSTDAVNGGVACLNNTGDTQPCNRQACSGPINCVGNFGGCSAPCGPTGTKIFTVSTGAANGGAACLNNTGDTQPCNRQACAGPINCVGSWSGCSAACDGGTQTFSITTAAANVGAACGFANNATRDCNTQLCSAVTDCAGGWGPCSAACDGGTQTYYIGTPAANGGAACAYASGATQVCNTQVCPPSPVNCVGSWTGCSQPCGGGTMTYGVITAAANGGASCPSNDGDSLGCNSQACAVDTDCAGYWSACDPVAGTKSYTVTQAQQGIGAACPSPLTVSCPVDCAGSWSSCGGGPPPFKTYTWSPPPLNGGSTAACSDPNGRMDFAACTQDVDCAGTWGACNSGTSTESFNMTQAPSGSGAACPTSPRGCVPNVDCAGTWGACNSGTSTESFNMTQAPSGSGAACPVSPRTCTPAAATMTWQGGGEVDCGGYCSTAEVAPSGTCSTLNQTVNVHRTECVQTGATCDVYVCTP